MSGDLTAFLRARLDEDEAEAKATADADAEFWADVKGDGTHFGLHDPARVLREVAAGRAILGLHHPTQPHPEFGFTYPGAAKFCGYDGPGDNWQAEHEPDHFPDALWPCWTVRLLAAVYSDHPGYRPEWKP
jgi:hypothetical protein